MREASRGARRGASVRAARGPAPRVPPVLGVCAAHVLVAALLFDLQPFTGGDNFYYMLLGEALRTGQGYREFWVPGAPPHAHFPPFYPAVLALVGTVSASVLAFKLVSLACTTAAVALTYRLAEARTGRPELALSAAAVVAVAPAVVEYAHWVLSEPLFLVLVLATLSTFERDPEARSARTVAAGALAAAAAYATRSAGTPLVAAVVLALAVRRRWRPVAAFAGVAAAAVGAWWAWARWAAAHGAVGTTYGQEFLYRDPYRPELGTLGPGDLVARVSHNLGTYVLSAWPQALGGRDLDPALAGMFGIALGLLLALALLRGIRRLRVTELYAAAYAGLLLLWPEPWGDLRFLLPLVPVAAVWFAELAAWAFPGTLRAGSRTPVPAAATAVAVLVAVAAFADIRAMPDALRCTARRLGGERFACVPPPFADFVRAAEWLRSATPPDAVVISRKPQILYWYGRRRGDLYPYSDDPDRVLRAFDERGAEYAVVDRLSATTYRYLVPALQAHAERFRIVYRVGDPPTLVVQRVQSPTE